MSLLVVDFKFTFWGLVGACVWVVNGTVAIVAVQKCGLSTAQTLWSGLSVFVGFLWGVIVFEENVRDVGRRRGVGARRDERRDGEHGGGNVAILERREWHVA